MIACVWTSVDYITDNWHSGGAVLVIASDVQRAADRVKEHCLGVIRDSEQDPALFVPAGPPDKTWELVGEPEEELMIFPDAGCC